MADDRAFLNAIIENPDDDGPRLVYADWLDEQGDHARAEFIRIQCEMAKFEPESVRWYELSLRSQRLLQRHQPAWLRDIQKYVRASTFRRGFVESVSMTARRFLKHGDFVFTHAPIRELVLSESRDLLSQVLASPHLGRLHTLDLSFNRIDDSGALLLTTAPNLSGLTNLDLWYNEFGARGWRALERKFGRRVRMQNWYPPE
jgi:uncharacterized protein (TIGR02996 family)